MTRTARFRHAYLAAALLVAAMVAGCDSSEPEPSIPPPTVPATPAPTPEPEREMEAPSVSVPLDASPFIVEPCQSLTKAQVVDLNLDPERTEPHRTDSMCTWWGHKAEASAGVHYKADPLKGLSDLYELQDGFFPRWEPTEIAGYPAVLLGNAEAAGEVTCHIAVGLTDSLYFTAVYRNGYVGEVGDEKSDENCAVARDIAAMVVENVKSSD